MSDPKQSLEIDLNDRLPPEVLDTVAKCLLETQKMIVLIRDALLMDGKMSIGEEVVLLTVLQRSHELLTHAGVTIKLEVEKRKVGNQ